MQSESKNEPDNSMRAYTLSSLYLQNTLTKQWMLATFKGRITETEGDKAYLLENEVPVALSKVVD